MTLQSQCCSVIQLNRLLLQVIPYSLKDFALKIPAQEPDRAPYQDPSSVVQILVCGTNKLLFHLKFLIKNLKVDIN